MCLVFVIALEHICDPPYLIVIGAVFHKQESRHKVPKSVLRAVLGRMQFTLHATRRTAHGASRLVQAMSAWLMKTRRAPSRHSRDARIYGHTTTAMHKLSLHPAPLVLPGSTGQFYQFAHFCLTVACPCLRFSCRAFGIARLCIPLHTCSLFAALLRVGFVFLFCCVVFFYRRRRDWPHER